VEVRGYVRGCSCAGDIIDRLHELQSLKVDETKDKDKQKSEAKSIVRQRRKALTDLFKALELIGVLLQLQFHLWLQHRNCVVYMNVFVHIFCTDN